MCIVCVCERLSVACSNIICEYYDCELSVHTLNRHRTTPNETIKQCSLILYVVDSRLLLSIICIRLPLSAPLLSHRRQHATKNLFVMCNNSSTSSRSNNNNIVKSKKNQIIIECTEYKYKSVNKVELFWHQIGKPQ